MKARSLAMLALFYLISAPIYADTCPVKEFRNKSANEGFGDIQAVESMARELVAMAADKNDACRDELVSVFKAYHNEARQSYERKHISNWIYPISRADLEKANATLAKAGWALRMTEGFYYIGKLEGWLETALGPMVTPAYREYFTMRSVEIQEGFSDDAMLLISWEKLGERIIKWETFLKKHPNFREKAEIEAYLNIYIRTFLTGMDNSRILEFDSRRLLPEVRTAYEKFLKENKSSRYHALVDGYYRVLKENGFVVNEKTWKYLEQQNQKTMLGIQPPVY